MIGLLNRLNYHPPKLREFTLGDTQIINKNGVYYLYVDGCQWMAYNTNTHEDAYSLYSHYDLAYGDVIVSGLGFGVRESWVLSKPEVKKLTILEKNSHVIDYHLHSNSEFLNDSRVKIINCDASEYQGSCDVLLLDHYETQSIFDILIDAKKIHDNIESRYFWFWPFERIIMHSRKWHTDNEVPQKLYTKYEAFNMLKKHHGFDNMPNLSEDQINLYCMMHHSTVFSRSEEFLNSNCKDRKLFHNIYVSV